MDADQKKLTDFFSSASKPPPKKRKRSTLVAEGSGSHPAGGSKDTKRAKSDTPKAAPVTTGRKTRGATRANAISLLADDDELLQSTQFKGKGRRSPSPVRTLRKALPKLAIAPGPVISGFDSPDSPLTPLSDEYDTDPMTGSSKEVSMTSVTSADVDSGMPMRASLEQPTTRPVDFSTPRHQRILVMDSEEEDDVSEPLPAPRFGLATPRNKRIMDSGKEDDLLRTPSIIPSSQSQYLSPWKSSPTKRRSPRKTPIQKRLMSDDDIVESSQSQERELDLSFVPNIPGAAALRLDTETPCPSGSLGKRSPLSQGLAVGDMSLSSPVASQPRSDSSHGTVVPSKESAERDCEHYSQRLSQAASFPYDDFPQPDSLPSQLPSPRRIVQAPGYDADDSATEYSDDSESERLPPSSAPRSSSHHASPSPVESESPSQDTYCSIPPELADIRDMFRGDGSYPPDFPMSLR
ncbi:hypothetical protein BKA70DRAFT_1485538 [Coprinopsis sp. MPI-PUGE-AT-0042]|nr:hypothetical protein BKA70DRAFT_1485538 [Coprinopsis sp. MPI-PUGE-AT-0042]